MEIIVSGEYERYIEFRPGHYPEQRVSEPDNLEFFATIGLENAEEVRERHDIETLTRVSWPAGANEAQLFDRFIGAGSTAEADAVRFTSERLNLSKIYIRTDSGRVFSRDHQMMRRQSQNGTI